MRSALHDLTSTIPATICYQSNYVERYSRYMRIPILEQNQLYTLYAKEKEEETFIYRTPLGIYDQLFIRLNLYKQSKMTKAIERKYLIDISEVILKFPKETKFLNDSNFNHVSFPINNIHGYDYRAPKVKPDSPSFFAVVYKLPNTKQVPGMLIINMIISFLSLCTLSLDGFGTKNSRTDIIVYALCFTLCIGATIYFWGWNQRYFYDNMKEFVAPGVAALVLFIFLLKNIIGAISASRHARTLATATAAASPTQPGDKT